MNASDLERFGDLIRAVSGIAVTPARRPELERAVAQTVAELSLPGPDALYHLLAYDERNQPLLDALIAKLTVGETYFFRNRPQFDALEQSILPSLIARRHATHTLRLWSAGCATGEEPYSLAILLQRLLPDLAAWNILILATDINHGSLERARRGVYGSWSFREGAVDLQPLFFTQRDSLFEISSATRRLVQFAYLNLASAVYPSTTTNTHAMDLILCRNVLIYFDEEVTKHVAARMYAALAEDGWLIVGHSEPSQAVFHQFASRNFPGTVVYQKAPSQSNHEASASQLPGGSPSGEAPFASAAVPNDRTLAVSPVGVTPRVHLPPAPPRLPRPAPVVRTPSPAHSDTSAAKALLVAGKESDAVTMLRELAAARPADGEPPYLLAKYYANSSDLPAAEEWIEVALQRAPLMAPAHYLRALILQEAGRPWEGLEALRGCVYAEPRFALAHFALAMQLAKLGQPQRAQKSLENVQQLLAGRDRSDLIEDGDGLTVGRLLDLISSQKVL